MSICRSFHHASDRRPIGTIRKALNRCGKRVEDATRKVEALADHVWNHLKVSPKPSDVAMAKPAQGTKVLTEGEHEKVFQQEFQILPGEKLLKTYACYVSTPTGSVIGTLYISTKRMAFCSDYPLCYYSSSGSRSGCITRLNPSEKYIHIVTRDGYDFWLMGFIFYNKALKTLTEALQHNLGCSGGNGII